MLPSFTNIFIKRPVLSTVISLLILVAGIAGIAKISLREYPQMTNTKITVTTVYPGASPSVIQGFVTTPLEQAIGSADGIDYMTATSTQSASTITAYMKLNYSPNAALTEITGKVDSVLNRLPSASKSPTILKSTGANMPQFILGFTSKTMSPEEISAYLQNVIRPKLLSVGGLQDITIWGDEPYAMRVWLNPKKMAQLGVTASEVNTALANNNFQAAPGQLKGTYRYIDIKTSTDIHSAKAFNNLVVKNIDGRLIRIKDVGKAVLGPLDYKHRVLFNGHQAVFAALQSTAGANPLSVFAKIKSILPTIRHSLPAGLEMKTVYDQTLYIKSSIQEVIYTLIEATIVVMVIIFLFLGAFRSVLIPAVTIPLSLIGVCFLIYMMGFSINLLTLLAMVLAIGLVVDDAIVVLENIYRHIEDGMKPFEASIQGAREIKGPVIVMSLTLAAVFIPIGFMGGFTGILFTQFAYTLAGAVILSGVIALTFSPMLCSKVLSGDLMKVKMVQRVDKVFNAVKNFYHRRLCSVLNYRSIVMLVAVVVITSCYFLYDIPQRQLAPVEDLGIVGAVGIGNSNSTREQLSLTEKKLTKIFKSVPEMEDSFFVEGIPAQNQIFIGLRLKPWNQRSRSEMQIVPTFQKKLATIPSVKAFAFPWPSLPGQQRGAGLTLVLTSTDTHQKMYPTVQTVVKQMQDSGLFIYVSSDLKFDMPQVNVKINRAKAGRLGITMTQIASALGVMFGDNNVNYFSLGGYSFEVVPQLYQHFRYNPQQLNNINLKTVSGKMIPLSSIVSLSTVGTPLSLEQFQQLNSATISAVPMPFISEGSAVEYARALMPQMLPKSMSYAFSGNTRQFVQQGDAMGFAFLFALIIIFLLLSAQFESFRDPFIILIAVPLSICGALIPLSLGAASLNIYTEVGLITLIGLISKHGILMVEFANKLQMEKGYSVRRAIEEAAAIRLRPVLMTTLTMVIGVMPLVFAEGAGAVSRHDIGLVIAFGMLIGTCFTLFVVPTVYTYIAKDHGADKAKME